METKSNYCGSSKCAPGLFFSQGKLAGGKDAHAHTGVHMPDLPALPRGRLSCSPAAPWGCGITPAPGEERTVQPSCSCQRCPVVSLPSLGLAFLNSRWWEKPETRIPLPLRNHQLTTRHRTLSHRTHPTKMLAANSGSVRDKKMRL